MTSWNQPSKDPLPVAAENGWKDHLPGPPWKDEDGRAELRKLLREASEDAAGTVGLWWMEAQSHHSNGVFHYIAMLFFPLTLVMSTI